MAFSLSGLFTKTEKQSMDIATTLQEENEEAFANRSSVLEEYSAMPSSDSPSSAVLSSIMEGGNLDAEDDAARLATNGASPALNTRIILSLLLVVALLVLVGSGWWMFKRVGDMALQVNAVGNALAQSQRLTKSALPVLLGEEKAFTELRDSSSALVGSMHGLQTGSNGVPALDDAYADELNKIMPLVDHAQSNVAVILRQQKPLTDAREALRNIGDQSVGLQDNAQQVLALEAQHGASQTEISAAGQLAVLTQRISKFTGEMLTVNGINAGAVVGLGRDIETFHNTVKSLLGSSGSAAHNPDTRAKLDTLLEASEQMRTQASGVNWAELDQAGSAQSSIIADSESLLQRLQGLQSNISSASGLSWGGLLLAILALVALLSAIGLVYVQLHGSRQRQQQAEQQRLAIEQQQQESKRINDANQAAILRLMNELQTVAEGDLTQEATVTEDITGAIADSVNYTVEELRALVGNVQGATARVSQTTSKVEMTSTELLATSTEQLREIHATGQSVVDMAGRINQVSSQAQESAQVAHQSLQAAASGLVAVQNSIGGMNTIRDQIQETSKRIKRLGESSQEIGEITELIADITEQTNVLALNAAIQAASAGEAGRGFSVVAEEVQRLAERSADATRQIAVLVKAIQTDTQDAAAAMERSTRGVVEGARLSDNAGTALSEIDRVSHQLAQIIEQISTTTAQEAEKANVVAGNIQHIFAVTEQTGESTRSTATQVRDLARIADELRQSVARFKIA